MPIEAVGAGKGTVEVTFKDPDMGYMVGIAMNASRFIPKEFKDIIARRGLYDDLVNHLYMTMIEFWRTKKFTRFAGATNQSNRYKEVVRYTWRSLYRMLREYIPEYKRKHYDKFMDPSRFVNVVDPFGMEKVFEKPFCRERDLVKVSEEKGV